ncbi:MAG TPA: 2,3-bisphosphoglycerate-independent phosphoglycerate mutase [Phycisphaerae bacterium]|nr:2,3-bisphosphoglycerate-independent phosphoglycerate mutase [Phycisphaerae bacterium]HNU44718.1 2,3-bisphosphoglycerate-independent phosphoglycerate mutase [Phycisphaerae bacterium]
MKYVLVIPSGAADEPVRQLDGRTPCEAARTPHLDWIAQHGRQGRVHTIPTGLTPDCDTGILALLGYNPQTEHPGRGYLEALAGGVPVEPDQVVLCGSFVTLVEGRMADFSAGGLSTPEAQQLASDLNDQIAGTRCRFHPVAGNRFLLVVSDAADFAPKCTRPHLIPEQPVAAHEPRGPGADWLKKLAERAVVVLGGHDVNLVRRDLGENPATDVWLWGPGRVTHVQPFGERFGLGAAVVAAGPLLRGLAKYVGGSWIEVAPAEGTCEPDEATVATVARRALADFDLLVVRTAGAEEAARRGDVGAKVAALERLDEHLVGPLLEVLQASPAWRILVAPDHTLPVGTRVGTRTPPPFCLAGHAIHPVLAKPFHETHAAAADLQIDPGHELMEYFLRR